MNSALTWSFLIILNLVACQFVTGDINDLLPEECLENDLSKAARLDRVCEDCYDLFKEPIVYSLCRRNCFGTEYLIGCIEVLRLEDEKDQLLSNALDLAGGVKIF